MKWTLSFLLLIPVLLYGQANRQPDAAKIKLRLKKLNVLSSVLYVAAHPDDENTRVITLLSNGSLSATAYLSMTRGDGGQNLIGPEIRDELGVIRTQELLTARKIDGGQQFFTRANDFGFSKSADETFKIWDKEEILRDVVKVFREFQPDVIITRFPPDKRAGHGHHTASAVLAAEAFDIAGQSDRYPEQLKSSAAWSPKRLYWNTSFWWDEKINADTPGVTMLDVGEYNSLLGTSYTEIAALSSSQHASQGYGQEGARGSKPEYLEFVKGEKSEKDIFANINTTWSRVPKSATVQKLVTKVISDFKDDDPSASIPLLLQIRKEIMSLDKGVWRDRKLAEVELLIQDCLGLFIGVTVDRYWASPSDSIRLTAEIVNRSAVDVKIDRMEYSGVPMDSAVSVTLQRNIPLIVRSFRALTVNAFSDPYWLKEPHTIGRFTVDDPSLIGKGENDPSVSASIHCRVNGERITFTRPAFYRWADPAKGERSRPFAVVPPVFVNIQEQVLIFPDAQPREVTLKVSSSRLRSIKGELKLNVPDGWKTEPVSYAFSLLPGQEDFKKFKVYPASTEATVALVAEAVVEGNVYHQSLHIIDYPHIPTQILLPNAASKLVRLNLKKEGSLIAYIKGAGDGIPAALRTMGYEVWEMKNEEVTSSNLSRVDAVVLGVRAFNVNDRMPFMIGPLMDYVHSGGTLVAQYNTKGEFEKTRFAPFSLSLSRSRVTEEDSEVRILKPDHPVISGPNKITSDDFKGWVQERGLNYPDKWDGNFEAILSMNDQGEKPLDGSLLIASYGSGHYVYTSLSFFRQLPEGVPGAFKLFANLVSLGHDKKTTASKLKTGTK